MINSVLYQYMKIKYIKRRYTDTWNFSKIDHSVFIENTDGSIFGAYNFDTAEEARCFAKGITVGRSLAISLISDIPHTAEYIDQTKEASISANK